MIKTLLRKEIIENKWILIIGLLFFTVSAAIVVFSYNLMDALSLPEIIDALDDPPQFLVSFLQESAAWMQDHTLYVWSQWHSNNVLQIGFILAIILGAVMMAREFNRGTISFLLSKPISREMIYITKVLAGCLIILLSILLPTIFLIVLSLIIGLDINVFRIILD
ncbi:ABC transporter permease subunit [Natranaerobius thermophilus]|uniref:ABC transporter permease n=1 Tax=Natranaerobius thermophilus (strain ATCC BAA-1301 / DSM 18059 / JW/NM-WN-LF) TaxID=457570 RepID=B2A0M4_NATTJ|nr:ABC transporter permease subunit [Natranaerobius thermophilus]ACB84582.1 hypothetical protein Nther_0998 [Natranaerobius thermophilus JW/NM-WN-LF]